MFKRVRRKFKVGSLSAGSYLGTFLKWTVIASVTGVVGGFVGSLFHISVNAATYFRQSHEYIIFALPLAGALITWLYHIFGLRNDGGTNVIIDSVRTKDHVPLRIAPLIFISTCITHLFGGSAGPRGSGFAAWREHRRSNRRAF